VNRRALYNSGLNVTLDDAIELLERELERLKVGLATCRRLDHPRRDELVRGHVANIDVRQDVLDGLYTMVMARRSTRDPLH
jgi:hypothetical protein